jgi:hypothetical protein
MASTRKLAGWQVGQLGMARSLGWRVHMRCADGYREDTKSIRRCVYRKQLDLDTLVWTRGPNFPLSRLESRLMCPACGSRSVTVLFEPPPMLQRNLLYTGLTRGKRLVVLVGQKKAIAIAVRNVSGRRRWSKARRVASRRRALPIVEFVEG